MTDLLATFFSDRLNILTIVLLAMLAGGVYIAFFTELKEEPRKKKS